MIGGRRPIKGRKPADRRVRVERPHAPYFRYTGPGQLVAKPAASGPRTGSERAVATVKEWLIGRPLASVEDIDQRLSKRLALPIFSSDAISSSAYATEEILRVLVLAGARGPVPVDPGRDRDLRAAGGGRDLLSPGLLRLSRRRRRVRRGPPGAVADPRARRRGRPAHRLRDDGRRVDVIGDGPADLDPAGPRAVAPAGRGRRDRLDHGRQPARAAGVGQPVRDPHLPVRRYGAGHRRVRPRPHRRRHGRAAPAPARGRARTGRRR